MEKWKPSTDFQVRYDAAKKWRREVEKDIKDALRFCANGRENDFTSISSTEPVEIFSTYAEEFSTDLASDLVTFYSPSEERWAEYEITLDIEALGLNPEDEQAIIKMVQSREDKLFGLIEGSNYYDVAPQIMFEAATHGTAAMWVEQSHIAQPIYVEAVPPHELLITMGHNGILDRFREKTVLSQHLKATLASMDADLSHNDIERKLKQPGEKFLVCWGFWLDWTDPAYPMWHMEIAVDGKRVTDENMELGPLAGTCPLLVGRFNPRVGRPWGRGPAIKALADIFTVDKVNEGMLTAIDYALNRPYTYPDDGILDMSMGLKPGMGYPTAPGAANTIQPVDIVGNIEHGWFSEDHLAERIRVAFYQDGPRQRGDTPPSATQWVDEARRVQRRIGKPSAPLWSEMILPFIQRVEYLGVLTGQIEQAITFDGRKLAVKPVSPLQKAQNQNKVLTTRSNLELAAGVFGEALPQVVDVMGTMANITKASGDDLLVFNNQQQAPNGAPPDPAG